MNLWTEYEGRTVAGDYLLETLLRSEGRSAFFKTHSQADTSAVIRLTEAHFDEEEMLKRWRQVAAVDQGNLIEIRKVGQTTLDGVALTYALLEPSDASLAEVLQERPLTVTETMQVAKAVVSALTALHRSGLVHEHIEPANILAVDETVKLRSDCVRPCVVDMEFSTAEDCAALRRRDVHDVGVLLLQCLTLVKEWKPTLDVPPPFHQLIPGAIDGSWSLQRMEALLDPPDPAAVAAAVNGASPRRSLVPDSVLQQASAVPAPGLDVSPEQDVPVPAAQFRPRNDAGLLRQDRSAVPPWVYAVAVLLIVFLGWLLFGRSSKPASAKAPAASPAHVAPVAGTIAKPSAARPLVRRSAIQPAAPAATTAGWHVVAYTYNREDQAQAKATHLQKEHASMQPQVFSPSGHAPFFVALGGAMSNQEAASLLQRAREAGLPRDTFMRNYR